MATTAEPRAIPGDLLVPRSMRVDPSRHLVPDEVPQSMLDNWQAMLDAVEAQRRSEREQNEARLSLYRRYADDLRKIVSDAYFMHLDLEGLAYLFDKALIDDAEGESNLLKASILLSI